MKNVNLYGTAVLISTLGLGLAGCNGRDPNLRAPIVDANAAATDPANANMIGTQVAGVSYAAQPQSSGTGYAPAAYAQTQQAPVQSNRTTRNEAYNYNTQAPVSADQQGQQQPAYDPNYPQQSNPNDQGNYDQQAANAAEYDEYDSLLDPNVPVAQQAPPPLPSDYEQPPAPADNYLWTPGYWDYASAGYYYVPGVWVAPPFIGALWTPGWWGGYGGGYRWHHGYWGRHIGFYGGVNYGFGYIGYGYQGGYWNNNHFWYNRAVNRFGGGYNPTYVYSRRVEVVNNTYINNTRISYYGGNGGIRRPPAPQELAAVREQRIPPMQTQVMHREQAMQNRAQFFSQNRGRPAMVATSQPLQAQRGIVAPPAGFMNNTRPGFDNRPGANGLNGITPQQRQQFQNMNPQQRQQFEQQRNQQQTLQNQQRLQGDQQRLQQELQQRNGQQQNQQRLQQEQQRTQQHMQQQEQQHNQQLIQSQQRQQQEQQRNQQQQMQTQQRQQQEQQRNQQEQVQSQQRLQQEQRAQQQMQQHTQQQEQQRNQQQQIQSQQRQQQEQLRAQQQQQMQQQRNQQQQIQSQQRQQQEQQRAQQQQMRQQVQQQHAAPQMQMHSAPPPAPHEGGGEHRR